MTTEQIPNSQPPSENPPALNPAPEVKGMGILPSLGIFLLEIILPAAAAGIFTFWISGVIKLWNLTRVLALVIFALIFIVAGFFVAFVLDNLTLPLRKRSTVKKVINRVTPRSRLVKIIVVGVLIPAGAFAAANLYVLPDLGTPMSLVEQNSLTLVKSSSATVIGDAVLSSGSQYTKLQGIKTLQAIHDPDSLDQLFRILNADPALLRDASLFETLSGAIASYGESAKKSLIDLYPGSSTTDQAAGGNPSQDPYTWYFSASFDELRKDIQAGNLDPSSRDAALNRLSAAEASVKQSLSTLPVQLRATPAPLPEFILHTFLAMDIQQDKDILQLARGIAQDNGAADSVRGQAFLLMAKFGGKDELPALYASLNGSDDYLKAKALEAIASLQSKVPPENNPK